MHPQSTQEQVSSSYDIQCPVSMKIQRLGGSFKISFYDKNGFFWESEKAHVLNQQIVFWTQGETLSPEDVVPIHRITLKEDSLEGACVMNGLIYRYVGKKTDRKELFIIEYGSGYKKRSGH